MALAIDASTPAFKAIGAAVTSQASNSFSPPANSLIRLFVSVGSTTGSTQSVTAVTDSLVSHLTWALIGRKNTQLGGGTTGATAEIWEAQCPSAQTSMTVTATFAQASLAGGGLLLPVVFTGAASPQTSPAVASNSATTGASTTTVVTTAPASLVVGVVMQWNSGTAPTAAASNTLTINGASADNGANYYCLLYTGSTASSGTSAVVATSAPTGTTGFDIIAAEVLAVAAAAGIPDLIMAPPHR